MKFKGILIAIIFPFSVWSQNLEVFSGSVYDENSEPLIGANVYWEGTTRGTVTDNEGKYKIAASNKVRNLIFSFVGYVNDTIAINEKKNANVVLKQNVELKEVQVVHKQKSTSISLLNPVKVENIGEKELLKAACCNLSESFETSPSVDVSFTDAVTGTRQIMLLGLAGPYTQITRESMPDVRGLSAIYGLTYIPGTWVESIQLIKGTGSVANGYESIAGQINVELRKPESADRLYLNLFGNEEGRMEANLNLTHKFQGNWSSSLLLHTSQNQLKSDHNNDGFLDVPLGENLIALNRWKYQGLNGLQFQAAIKGTYTDKYGGQVNFDPEKENDPSVWGMEMKTSRMEAWAKMGKVFLKHPGRSIGAQVSIMGHNQENLFGTRIYNADQQSFYTNILFQDILNNSNHQYRTGASFQWDRYNELLADTVFERKEAVPGVFLEYTYKYLEKLSVVVGIRGDFHNNFGFFTTPRLHLRYAPWKRTAIRLSVGKGQKTASILSENTGLLASSRRFNFSGSGLNKPYGLDAETAWTYGGSFTQKFQIDYREGAFSIDFFRTDFTNQIVVDLDRDPQQVFFYNLNGESYSNSFQAQLDYEIIPRLDGRLAYRWYDVKTTYNGTLLNKPLVAGHRAFTNLAYESRKHWKFDLTINWQGEKRIPNTSSNPEPYRLKEYSPDFYLVNAQVSKSWREKLEVYVGSENILNYKQKNPILSSQDSYGPYFDGSMIWGPVMGRSIYAGLRFRFK